MGRSLRSAGRNTDTLLHFIKTTNDETLYPAPMKGANNNCTSDRWAEAAGPSRFRSAVMYSESCEEHHIGSHQRIVQRYQARA